jgi:hypothetical protein
VSGARGLATGGRRRRGKKKGRKEKERRKRKKREKRKEEKGKKGKEGKKNREKKGKEIRKRFRKLGKLLGNQGKGCAGFSDFRHRRDFWDGGDGEADRPAGTAVCAGFPARWPTATLGRHAWVLARVRAVPAGFAARVPMVREGDGD